MFASHILVIHYMTHQHYIWVVFYDLLLMTIGWKMPHQTLNDYLSFASRSLQLRAFSHMMSYMIIKSIIHGVIGLRISSSVKTFQFILTHISYNKNKQCTSISWTILSCNLLKRIIMLEKFIACKRGFTSWNLHLNG